MTNHGVALALRRLFDVSRFGKTSSFGMLLGSATEVILFAVVECLEYPRTKVVCHCKNRS